MATLQIEETETSNITPWDDPFGSRNDLTPIDIAHTHNEQTKLLPTIRELCDLPLRQAVVRPNSSQKPGNVVFISMGHIIGTMFTFRIPDQPSLVFPLISPETTGHLVVTRVFPLPPALDALLPPTPSKEILGKPGFEDLAILAAQTPHSIPKNVRLFYPAVLELAALYIASTDVPINSIKYWGAMPKEKVLTLKEQRRAAVRREWGRQKSAPPAFIN